MQQENVPQNQVTPKKFYRLRKFTKPALQGLLSVVLFIVIISLAVIGVSVLSNNQSISGGAGTVWTIALIVFASIGGLLVTIGLPIIWGKSQGLRRIFLIIGFEMIFVIAGLTISGFIINAQNNTGSATPTTSPGTTCNPNDPNANPLCYDTLQN